MSIPLSVRILGAQSRQPYRTMYTKALAKAMYQSSLLLRTVLNISLTLSTSSAFAEYVWAACPDHFSMEGSPQD